MAKRPTLLGLTEQLKALRWYEEAATLLAVGETPDAAAPEFPDGIRYTYRVFGASRSHGGVVVVTTHVQGQCAHAMCYGFEERRALVRRFGQPWEQAVFERMTSQIEMSRELAKALAMGDRVNREVRR